MNVRQNAKSGQIKNVLVIVLSTLLVLFLIPWIVLLVWHLRKRRNQQVFKVALEQKNQVLLALTDEGRHERSKLHGTNGEQFSNAYAREKRFERVAFLAPERSFAEATKHTMTTCAICVEDFKHLDLVRETQCCHSFHSDCLMMWAKQKLWANTRFIGVP